MEERTFEDLGDEGCVALGVALGDGTEREDGDAVPIDLELVAPIGSVDDGDRGFSDHDEALVLDALVMARARDKTASSAIHSDLT